MDSNANYYNNNNNKKSYCVINLIGVWANEVISNMLKKAKQSQDMKDLKVTFYSAVRIILHVFTCIIILIIACSVLRMVSGKLYNFLFSLLIA